jgi:hypothetical protein
MLLRSLLVLFICGCCCSFSAVPAVPHALEQQAPPIKKKSKRQLRQEKRQLRLQKRQQRRLLRLQKRQQRSKQPTKNHALSNILGFILSLAAPVIASLGVVAILQTGLSVGLPILILGGITFIAGIVFCIIGLVGSQNAEKPKKGFGIAGLIIASIPVFFTIFILLRNLFFVP